MSRPPRAPLPAPPRPPANAPASVARRCLSLASNGLTDVGTEAVSEGLIAATPSIEEVYLQDNSISDHGATALAQTLRFCSSLRWVLAHAPLAVSVPALLRFFRREDLERAAGGEMSRARLVCRVLDLNGNRIKDHGARQVAQALHNSKKLELLKIRGVKLGWQGREAISQLMTALPKCKVLYDSGEALLAHLPTWH